MTTMAMAATVGAVMVPAIRTLVAVVMVLAVPVDMEAMVEVVAVVVNVSIISTFLLFELVILSEGKDSI